MNANTKKVFIIDDPVNGRIIISRENALGYIADIIDDLRHSEKHTIAISSQTVTTEDRQRAIKEALSH